jgi:hypothetical protein
VLTSSALASCRSLLLGSDARGSAEEVSTNRMEVYPRETQPRRER